MWFAIRRTPWGAPLLFTVGLLPVVVQTAATVSADPLLLGLACCLVAWTLRLAAGSRAPARPRDLVLLGAIGTALALCKAAYVPLVFLPVVIPTRAFGSLRRRIGALAAVIGIPLLAGIGWNLIVMSRVHMAVGAIVDDRAAADWIAHHPLSFLASIGRSWTDTEERNFVLAGLFTLVFHKRPSLYIPLWLGAIWLLAARFVDPVPRVVARGVVSVKARLGSRPGRGTSGTPSDERPGLRHEAPVQPTCDPTADRLLRVGALTRVVPVVIAIASFLAVE